MTDPNKIADAIAGVGEVAKFVGKVYEDAASPAVREFGLTVGSAVAVALKPVRGVLWTIEEFENWAGAAVQERVRRRSVPDSRIRSPDARLYAGVAVGMVSAGNTEELRDMFANLLATAMDVDTATLAHPAFAEILRQITPDEARLFASLATRQKHASVSVRMRPKGKGAIIGSVRNFVDAPMIPPERAQLVPGYIDNMIRLGLLEAPSLMVFQDTSPYATLAAHPQVAIWQQEIEAQGLDASLNFGVIRVTHFGKQFEAACILDNPRVLALAPQDDGMETLQPEIN